VREDVWFDVGRRAGTSAGSKGITKAKAADVYKGRPASIDAAQVRAMKAQGKKARLGDREGPQDRPGVGLSRASDLARSLPAAAAIAG
jgi:hypothetical protein